MVSDNQRLLCPELADEDAFGFLSGAPHSASLAELNVTSSGIIVPFDLDESPDFVRTVLDGSSQMPLERPIPSVSTVLVRRKIRNWEVFFANSSWRSVGGNRVVTSMPTIGPVLYNTDPAYDESKVAFNPTVHEFTKRLNHSILGKRKREREFINSSPLTRETSILAPALPLSYSIYIDRLRVARIMERKVPSM